MEWYKEVLIQSTDRKADEEYPETGEMNRTAWSEIIQVSKPKENA